MKTITISLFNRPEYTRTMIQNLTQCKGLKDYLVIFSIDYACDEVVKIAESFMGTNKEIFINKPKLGCGGNIQRSMDLGFSKSEYNIHLEDDIVPGRDCLQYFEFCNQQYKNDKSVFSITAFSMDKDLSPEAANHIIRAKWFHPWGWATWKDRWLEIRDDWDFIHEKGGWDVNMCFRLRKDRYMIKPILARVQNIGALNGVHTTPTIHKQEQFNEIWVNTTSFCESEFQELV